MPTHASVARRLIQLAEDIDRLGFGSDARILTALAQVVLDSSAPAHVPKAA